MILAFDTYYFDNKAKTVAIAFHHWTDEKPERVFSEILEGVAEYESGAFYKRELPCILSLLKQVNAEIEMIVVDGFVYLDDAYKPGLGAHLYEALEQRIPVIGVAKTNFAQIEQLKIPVYRGDSAKALFVTAIGYEAEIAARHVASMHGTYRLPVLLKLLDSFTKEL